MRKGMMLWFLIIGCVHGLHGTEVPKPLQESSSKTTPVPVFAYYGEPLCDSEGDLFFHQDVGGLRSTVIFKLARNVEDSLAYKLPGEPAGRVDFMAFAVTPSGEPYLLANDDSANFYVFTFDSSGDVRSKTRLDLPDQVIGQDLAVFEDGTILFLGNYVDSAPEQPRGKTYLALFAPSGKLLRELNRTIGPDWLDTSSKTSVQEGALTTAEDGNAYLLGSGSIVVLSPSGQVVRNIAFKKPNSDASATRVNVSQDLISITLTSVDKEHEAIKDFLVLDRITGKEYGYYKAGTMLGANVCFSRDEGFTFMRKPEDGNFEQIVKAPLR